MVTLMATKWSYQAGLATAVDSRFYDVAPVENEYNRRQLQPANLIYGIRDYIMLCLLGASLGHRRRFLQLLSKVPRDSTKTLVH